jgi:hypothetical protein
MKQLETTNIFSVLAKALILVSSLSLISLILVDPSLWEAPAAAIALLLLATNIDKLKKFNISTKEGISAETWQSIQQVEKVAPEVRKVALANAGAIVAIAFDATGYGESFSDESKVALLDRALVILDATCATEIEQDEIISQANDWYRSEWLSFFSGRLSVQNEADQALVKRIIEMPLANKNPKEIIHLLKSENILDKFSEILIQDLDYWLSFHKHRDISRWKQRTEWSYFT